MSTARSRCCSTSRARRRRPMRTAPTATPTRTLIVPARPSLTGERDPFDTTSTDPGSRRPVGPDSLLNPYRYSDKRLRPGLLDAGHGRAALRPGHRPLPAARRLPRRVGRSGARQRPADAEPHGARRRQPRLVRGDRWAPVRPCRRCRRHRQEDRQEGHKEGSQGWTALRGRRRQGHRQDSSRNGRRPGRCRKGTGQGPDRSHAWGADRRERGSGSEGHREERRQEFHERL